MLSSGECNRVNPKPMQLHNNTDSGHVSYLNGIHKILCVTTCCANHVCEIRQEISRGQLRSIFWNSAATSEAVDDAAELDDGSNAKYIFASDAHDDATNYEIVCIGAAVAAQSTCNNLLQQVAHEYTASVKSPRE